ncbi:hypothetical protein [Geomesophilobacter sediminis]|uniref:Organic solvent tolerance-like N-terminal domain-containing protein n=1 Tax=Geomesophilobacter sediminis TaxID=2798584 RepID=A0A8J7LV31_9BACT|nr:hypothetical protein [Geomesophilobacter sediminis]MBJ6724480.1 hypothetical protein [Geomesophilobacter sediminis]
MKLMFSMLMLSALSLFFIAPVPVDAVSYPVSPHREISEHTAMTVGATVYLFHSGTPDVKKAVAVSDILVVFGERHGELTEVGKIKVRSYLGDCYLQGEVLEGEVRHDDVARKSGAALLVILKEEMMK